MIRFKHKGNFSKTIKFMKRASEVAQLKNLDHYGREGVNALSLATPRDTGLTAESWYYKINRKGGSVTISFHNKNVQSGVPIAIILQYGHGTRTGGWVEGRDYINPSIQPIFDKIVEDAWREVTGR